MAEAAATTETQTRISRTWIGPAAIPYVLAVLFGVFALHGVTGSEVGDPDAARHAMNGALIYDMVRTGNFWHPTQYARQYYAQYPAISIPYHPPGFPVVESLFFALGGGVSLLSARLAIALAVAFSAILLYRLVYATGGSHALAACVVVTLFSLWNSRRVASDVMLEFPCLVLTLGALYVIRDLDLPWTLRRAVLFGVLAGAAVWTKQHAVFLGAVPVLWPILARRPRLLRQPWLWIGLAIFGAAVLALVVLSAQVHNTGVGEISVSSKYVRWVMLQRAQIYWVWMLKNLRGLPLVFGACALAAYVWARFQRPRRELRLGLYLVWILVFTVLLMALHAVDPRYLFFVYPAVLVVLYSCLFEGCASLLGEHRRWYLPAAFAFAWFVAGFSWRPEFVQGPSHAAIMVTQHKPARVVYAGGAVGNFIFDVRTRDPHLEMMVIQARRLPRETMHPAELAAFCHIYGIDWIVFQDEPQWRWMEELPPSAARFERSIPLRSTFEAWNGNLMVYRIENKSDHPAAPLKIPIPRIGGDVEVAF